ncbi:MAG: DUF3237 domain-containing protein [Burkholderiaceae bacterium]
MNLLETRALPAISTRLLWEAIVDIAPTEDLGAGPLGGRAIVPIVGGRFRGGPELADFHGEVLAGGADRQLLRADGVKELDALYEMRVHDGTLLTVRNRVIIDDPGAGPRYALSRIHLTVPAGRWDWLNRRLFLGTLQSARPERQAVIIRGWEAVATYPQGG